MRETKNEATNEEEADCSEDGICSVEGGGHWEEGLGGEWMDGDEAGGGLLGGGYKLVYYVQGEEEEINDKLCDLHNKVLELLDVSFPLDS